MRGTIELYRTKDAWMADFHRASNNYEIASLFGQYVIPTPFTSLTDAETVRAEIQSLNHNDTVVITLA